MTVELSFSSKGEVLADVYIVIPNDAGVLIPQIYIKIGDSDIIFPKTWKSVDDRGQYLYNQDSILLICKWSVRVDPKKGVVFYLETQVGPNGQWPVGSDIIDIKAILY